MRTLPTLLAVAMTITMARSAAGQADAAAVNKSTTTKPSTQPSGPIEHNKLKTFLPEKLAGLKRKEATSERTEFGNMKFSSAFSTYGGDENKRDAPEVSLQVFDYGSNSPMLQGMTAWTSTNVDQEGDHGFTKSLKIQDHPAIQTYLNEGKAGQMQLLVSERFLMTINTANLSVEQFKKLGDELKLKDLAALAK